MIELVFRIKSGWPAAFLFLVLGFSIFSNTGFVFAPSDQGRRPLLAVPEAPDPHRFLAANAGAGDGDEEGEADEAGGSSEPVDVIRNGGFEERNPDPMVGVALEWNAYSNGQAHFGWYDETWPEAVFSGEHAQLMEIFLVEGDLLERIIAIHQTVDVVPQADYDLTLRALMRSEAPESLRNKDEYEMSWGVDYFGEGDIENVEEWSLMSLTEQARLGSHGEFPDNEPLFYEVVTGTIRTRDSHQITLFIRGMKKFPTGTEVNFDVDDVSLVGPVSSGDAARPGSEASQTSPAGEAAEEDKSLPVSGGALPKGVSLGVLLLGGLVIVLLGAAATTNLLLGPEKR